jgi:hypothetical protein
MQFVNINIKKGGSVTIDAVGFTGTSCKAATAAFEQALGTIQVDQDKPELFETLSTDTNVSN